jgi:hypothetical protein
MNNNDVIEIVKSSNIPEEAMLYVLSAVATCNNRKWEFDREFREKILASMPIGESVRIKEICAESFPRFSIQRISRQMHYLVLCGAVKREEVKTGRTIKVTREKWVCDDRYCGWRGHYETEELEIEERIAVFTRRY